MIDETENAEGIIRDDQTTKQEYIRRSRNDKTYAGYVESHILAKKHSIFG